jgi:hypothetical protein
MLCASFSVSLKFHSHVTCRCWTSQLRALVAPWLCSASSSRYNQSCPCLCFQKTAATDNRCELSRLFWNVIVSIVLMRILSQQRSRPQSTLSSQQLLQVCHTSIYSSACGAIHHRLHTLTPPPCQSEDIFGFVCAHARLPSQAKSSRAFHAGSAGDATSDTPDLYEKYFGHSVLGAANGSR